MSPTFGIGTTCHDLSVSVIISQATRGSLTMKDVLSEVLAELNLQPGQSHCVQVNGYHLEIRRPAEPPSDLGDMVMLEPWLEFPRSTAVAIDLKPGHLPLP